MKILALDTATEACSAAVLVDDSLQSRSEVAPRKHAELLLPMIDALLAEAELSVGQLDAIAFGRGPGAFTGVRIAAGVTQGLALAADVPVIPISSLAAMAQSAVNKADTIMSAIDARMGEIYWCHYESKDDRVEPLQKEQVSKAEDVTIELTGSVYGIGTGWDTYNNILSDVCKPNLTGHDGHQFPLAEFVALLAISEFEKNNVQTAEMAIPIYVRNQVVDSI